MTVTTFLPNGADRATVLAYLDAHPDWEKNPDSVLLPVYRHVPGGTKPRLLGRARAKVVIPVSGSPFEAIEIINAVILDLPDEAGSEAVERLVAIVSYHQPAPGSPVCQCGLTAPCPTAHLATGEDTPS